MYKKIRINDLVNLNNPLIIDVREPNEFQAGHIPSSVNIPADIILNNPEKYLSINKPYYIYCETNLRSSKVCEFLSNMGYNVVLVNGGYRGWIQAM